MTTDPEGETDATDAGFAMLAWTCGWPHGIVWHTSRAGGNHVQKTTLATVAVVLAQCLTLIPAAAQADLPAALIGTWDEALPSGGTDEGNGRRRLVIRSVEKSADGWRVDARYGTPGETLGKPQTVLEVVRGEAILTVRSPGGAELALRLQDGKYLVGPDRGPSRAPARPIRFERTTR
jgi:hypothetical protein